MLKNPFLTFIISLIYSTIISAQSYNYNEVGIGLLAVDDSDGDSLDLWEIYLTGKESDPSKTSFFEYGLGFGQDSDAYLDIYTYSMGLGKYISLNDVFDVYGSIGFVGYSIDANYVNYSESDSSSYVKMGIQNDVFDISSSVVDDDASIAVEFNFPLSNFSAIIFKYSSDTQEYENGYALDTTLLSFAYRSLL